MLHKCASHDGHIEVHTKLRTAARKVVARRSHEGRRRTVNQGILMECESGLHTQHDHTAHTHTCIRYDLLSATIVQTYTYTPARVAACVELA